MSKKPLTKLKLMKSVRSGARPKKAPEDYAYDAPVEPRIGPSFYMAEDPAAKKLPKGVGDDGTSDASGGLRSGGSPGSAA